MDVATAGLLDGLEGEAREARRQLLERLLSEGVSLEELKAAVAEDRLALLPVERVLGGRYSAREIERRTGLPAELLVRIRRLQGLPEPGLDDREFADQDIAAAEATRLFLKAGLDEPAVAQITRVLGESMARLAATTGSAFVETFLEPGESEEQVAMRFAELARELVPELGPVLIAAYQAHLRENVRRGMLGRAELETGHLPDAQEVTVCFADLVGFTRLGGEIGAEELGTVADTLGGLAADMASPPVRLVKTIGDAAMFVSPDAASLIRVALSLIEAVEAAELPSLRAGMASGSALQRAGDFYGHSVNLASRVTGIARPGSVLCTEDVHDAAAEEFQWSFAGRHRLRGVAESVVLYRARRGQLEPTHDPGEADLRARSGASRRRRGQRSR